MQEKIEDIKYIQSTIWGMYKEFLENEDFAAYKFKMYALINECNPLNYFIKNLVHIWIPLVKWLFDSIKNKCDVTETKNCIKHIQNFVWSMYVSFLSEQNMKKWNESMGVLVKEYAKKGDQQILTFVQNLLIAWCLIISGFAEEFNNGNS